VDAHVRQREAVAGLKSAARAGAGKAQSLRFERVDALRGTAIVWMAAFHFCFDLNYFRFIQQNFYVDPFWTVQRTLIVSLFMFTVGVGQAIALHQGQGWQRFWRRWMQIAGCAVLVSVGSAVMFPNSFISFGVLHGIALILVVVRLTQGLGPWLWLAGALAILLPQWIQHAWFDTRWTNWVGLVTRKPVTEDYAPLLPWLGVVWWGLASGRWVLSQRPMWLSGALPKGLDGRLGLAGLALLGRWSLSFYMLHQPVLIGLLWLVTQMR
jgi:uncharacterized membrane protein